MKKNGFTVVELLAAFSLTIIISIFLYEILIEAKEIYVEATLKTSIQEKMSIVSKNIRNLLKTTEIDNIICSNSQCTNNNENLIKINHVANINQPDSIKIGNHVITMPKDGVKYIKIADVKINADNTSSLKVHFKLTSPNLSKPYVYNTVFTLK